MDYVVYGATKLVAYCMWCWIGLRILAPSQVALSRSLRYGSYRWLLGLLFGVVAGVALGSVDAVSVTALYFGVYIPLRVVEWSILAVVVQRTGGATLCPGNTSAWLWIAGGIVVSFLSDLASPDGMAGRFCVGRCLC